MTNPAEAAPLRRLEGKLAVVTGASRGIGRAVAKALAAEGAHIIAVARTVGGLESLDDEIKALGSSATLVPQDLKDGEAIDRLGGAIFERWKKLDILVGNAGMLGNLTPLQMVPPDQWQDLLAINVTANWRLLRSFDVLLRQSEAGRVIFVTSTVARDFRAYWGPYATTKAALEAMALSYAQDVQKTKIKVNLINPGPVATKMRARAMPGEDPASIPQPEDVAPLFVELALPDCTRQGEVLNYRDFAAA